VEDKDASKILEIASQSAPKFDNYMNILSGFGGNNDPMSVTRHRKNPLRSFNVHEDMFEGEWLSRRIAEVLPEDATREFIEFKTEDEEIEQKVNDKMEELNLREVVEESYVLSRIYGGSINVIGTDGTGEPEEPLDLSKLDAVVSLSVLDRRQVHIKSVFEDPMEPNFGLAEFYTLHPVSERGIGLGIMDSVHSSRTVRFDGDYLPKRMRVKNDGWHNSIYDSLDEALKFHGTSLQSGSVLLQDFVTKVLKIPNFAELIMAGDIGSKTIEARVQLANAKMSSAGITVIGEGEEFEKIQTPIQGLVQLFDKFIENVSAASGIPRARLFGQQLGTLAGAEETTRAYFDYIKAQQKKKLSKQIQYILFLLLNSNEITGGKVPEKWSFQFKSLWQPSDKEVAETMKIASEADKNWIDSGVLDPDEVRNSRFTQDGFSLDTNIEGDIEPVEPEEGEDAASTL
jgi:phage-related protein (TIGR01555 family)